MLVLTRRIDEDIVIGDGIRVRLLSTKGTSARLGIIAPRHIPVHRGEIYEEICGRRLANMPHTP